MLKKILILLITGTVGLGYLFSSPPTVSISTPTNGANVSGSTDINVNASDGDGISKVLFYIDSVCKSTDTGSPYMWTWDTTLYTNAAHTITVKAYDTFGTSTNTATNTSTATISVTVNNNDITPPVVSGVTPINVTSSSVVITWTTNELANSKVEYGLTTIYGSETSVTDTGGVFTHNVPLNGLAANTIYHYRIVTADMATNPTTTGDYSFTTSTAPSDNPPTVSISTYTNGNTIAGLVNITGVASDDHGVSRVEFYIDNVCKSTDTSAPYTWSWDTTVYSNVSHTIKVLAYDTISQSTSSQISVTVNNNVADNPPTVSISTYTNGNTVAGLANITAIASDDHGVSRVEFYIDNVCKSTDTSAPYTWSWDTTVYSNASHTIKVLAYDTISQSTSSQISVTVNNSTVTVNTPPVASDQSVSATKDTAKTITLTASDADGDLLSYSIVTSPAHGTLEQMITIPEQENSKCTYTPASGYTGTDSFTFKVNDGKVDSNIATVSITVVAPVADNLPTVSITSPASGATVSGNVNVTVSASDDNGVTQVSFYIDNVFKSTDSVTPYSWSWNTTGYSNGSHIIKVIATDTANQTTNTEITVTVSNVYTIVNSTPTNIGITAEIKPTDTVINPVSGQSTKINFTVGGKTAQFGEVVHVTVAIYNARGEKVKTLIDEDMAVGAYQSMWNGRNFEEDIVASGVYVVRMKAGKDSVSKKIVVIK
ncbi:MAG: Ig-like domain-containing protein [Elusimicrobia bacterium]|nr:Ig-like domain-containing protein [Elusimicrobiota bacterium]